jgi:integrase
MKLNGQISLPTTANGRDTLLAGTNSGVPSTGDYEKMARRRFQDPKPTRRGQWWYLLYWEDQIKDGRRIRKRKREKLGPASMPEREARKISVERLRGLNQGLLSLGSASSFEDYVKGVYEPVVMPLFATSTKVRYESVIKNYLMPTFGLTALREISAVAVQRYLSDLAGLKLSHESKDKVRDTLSSILGSAVNYQYLVKNPVEGLKLPPGKRGKRIKPYITPQQFQGMIQLIREPYATMVYVAVYTGLRVSELVGLKWGDVQGNSITIDERYCRGDWGAPKSAASNATIPVNDSVIQRIEALKSMTVAVRAGRATRRYQVVRASGSEDLVFQSLVKGVPMRDNNILVRHIKPAAKRLGLPWVNWQVLRRSFATWLKLAGTDVKDAQGLMRHSRASTTLDVYQQFVPESQRKAVERLGQLYELGRVN